MSWGEASPLPARLREALTDALAPEAGVVSRVFVRRGDDGRPRALIELTAVPADLEVYKLRIEALVQHAGSALGGYATKVGFSPGDRPTMAPVAAGATLAVDCEAPQ